MMRVRWPAALLAASLPAAAQDPAIPTVIEDRIAAQNPCAGLVTEIAGQRVGIDRLDEIVLREADASLRDNDVALTFSGRLGCRTSDQALFKGDASAAVTADAQVSLADCDAASLDVQLSDFGGSFAAVLEALKPVLELQIVESARPALITACHDLRGGG